MDYSVLMSVYDRERPEYLQESMLSILRQTAKTNDMVLVCDGPLNDELDTVIADMQIEFGDILHVVRLKTNMGLGTALNIGLEYCKNELVGRMDTDDISLPDRFEKQLYQFQKNSDLKICSGTVQEFDKDINIITGQRILPENHEEIVKFSQRRNPFNHPAVMLRKSAVQEVGGYSEKYHLLEDYYLWVRMLQNGCRGYNIQDVILKMRVSKDAYRRRGGLSYARNLMQFHGWLLKEGWSNWATFLLWAIPHALVCMMPNECRGIIYRLSHL